MNFLKIVGITTLIISYGLLALHLTLEIQNSVLFNTTWIVGIISFLSNMVYAIKTNVDNWIISTMGTCGLIWLVPFWLSTTFGILSILGFLLMGIHIHLRKKR